MSAVAVVAPAWRTTDPKRKWEGKRRELDDSCVHNHRSIDLARGGMARRFDESSSDMTSRDTASTTSHRERMSIDSDSHSSEEPTPLIQCYQPGTDVCSTNHTQQSTLASKRNGCARTIAPWTGESLILPDNLLMHKETLRWEGTLSDEEEESTRIECYKENRRRRYQEALMQKKEHISRNTNRKQLYYTSPATLATMVT